MMKTTNVEEKLNDLKIKDIQQNEWDFGNNILYKMCRENFEHKETDKILAKVLFIGRIYAAAVERRKTNDDIANDEFYIKHIAPAFEKSSIDKDLKSLKGKTLKEEHFKEILEVHKKLVKDLYEITGLDKRSFASKYLHFHLPDLFFIYDSRAVTALGKYKIKSKLSNKFKSKTIDKEYANFFCKCFELKNIIDKLHNVQITPRHLDNLLIENANNDLK